MKRLTLRLVLLSVSLLVPLGAAAQSADSGIVREIFTCSFRDGKDMSDLMAARDFYLRQMEKGGQKAAQAFVWTPFKVPANFDFLWANNYPDLMTFARATDAYYGSAEGQAAEERFDTVATCTSSLANRRQFYQADGELNVDETRGALLNAFACSFRRGNGPADLDDLLGHIASVMGSVDRDDGFTAYVSVPSIGQGPNTRDFYLYGVNASLETWAARTSAMNASPGMPALLRHVQNIASCDAALFYGLQVVTPQ